MAAFLASRGFFSLQKIGEGDKLGEATVGGRVDLKKEINDIDFTLSVTDASVKDYDAAPWVKDLLVTADKRVNDRLAVSVGYDTGVKNAFASATATGDVSEKPVAGTATWFQADSSVRTEGTVQLDSQSKLWGVYTFGAEGQSVANRTFVNLQERKGFIIEPFAINVATCAARYTLEKDDYTFEPAYDFNRNAAFLQVGRKYDNTTVKGGYAFKDEVALLEVLHRPTNPDLPDVRFFVKANAGVNGFSSPSAGLIFDKFIDLN